MEGKLAPGASGLGEFGSFDFAWSGVDVMAHIRLDISLSLNVYVYALWIYSVYLQCVAVCICSVWYLGLEQGTLCVLTLSQSGSPP